MKALLESLWDEYVFDKNIAASEEERKINHELVCIKDKLIKTLNKDQLELLNKYDHQINLLLALSSKQGYLIGVSFASEFLLEALNK